MTSAGDHIHTGRLGDALHESEIPFKAVGGVLGNRNSPELGEVLEVRFDSLSRVPIEEVQVVFGGIGVLTKEANSLQLNRWGCEEGFQVGRGTGVKMMEIQLKVFVGESVAQVRCWDDASD